MLQHGKKQGKYCSATTLSGTDDPARTDIHQTDPTVRGVGVRVCVCVRVRVQVRVCVCVRVRVRVGSVVGGWLRRRVAKRCRAIFRSKGIDRLVYLEEEKRVNAQLWQGSSYNFFPCGAIQ